MKEFLKAFRKKTLVANVQTFERRSQVFEIIFVNKNINGGKKSGPGKNLLISCSW
jgi:hypothetical protein